MCWFDEERCKEGLEALANYKKEFDEKKDIWKLKPLHNWASHYADAFRYFAVGYRKLQLPKLKPLPKTPFDPHSPF